MEPNAPTALVTLMLFAKDFIGVLAIQGGRKNFIASVAENGFQSRPLKTPIDIKKHALCPRFSAS